MLPVLLLAGFAAILAVDTWLLRASAGWVRRRGRRTAALAGMAAWLVQTALLSVGLLLLTGSLLPETVREPGVANRAWIESVAASGIILGLALLARTWHRPTFVDVGLVRGSGTGLDVGAGLVIGIVAAAVPLLIGLAGGWTVIGGLRIDFASVFAAGVFFAAVGVFEEVLYRGALFGLARVVVGRPVAAAVSILAFAVPHALNPGASPLAVVGVLVAGSCLLVAYVRSAALWLPIGIHVGWNFALGPIYGLPVSGLELPGLLRTHVDTTAPPLLAGGGFGPEASFPGMVGFLFATAAAVGYTSWRRGAGTRSGDAMASSLHIDR